jgi:molybdopterin biosynthesis enzyme MoaB
MLYRLISDAVTKIFCLSGALNAYKTAWERIISAQLDENAQDCNFLRQLSVV